MAFSCLKATAAECGDTCAFQWALNNSVLEDGFPQSGRRKGANENIPFIGRYFGRKARIHLSLQEHVETAFKKKNC